jgi:hypothetical protein
MNTRIIKMTNQKIFILFQIIKNMRFNEPIILLGRWKIDNCNIKMYNKIDYSNKDNCGTCYFSRK